MLKKKEIEARLVIYDNISDYLLTTGSGLEERVQAIFIRTQIKTISDKFYKDFGHRLQDGSPDVKEQETEISTNTPTQ